MIRRKNANLDRLTVQPLAEQCMSEFSISRCFAYIGRSLLSAAEQASAYESPLLQSPNRRSPNLAILSLMETTSQTPTIFAISDLHLSHAENVSYFSALPSYKDDFPKNSGLILAGDVGESITQLRQALDISLQVFRYVWWVPGNHELYTVPKANAPAAASTPNANEPPSHKEDAEINLLKGEPRYHAFVQVCRSYPNVFTPEDEWMIFDPSSTSSPLIKASAVAASTASPTAALICPLFTLYDYSFRPAHISTVEEALSWAEESDTYATDEALLFPDPHANKQTWCSSLITHLHTRLARARASHPSLPFILINHWPLSEAVLHIPRIPRFSLWCGSRRTAQWTSEFAPVSVVVSGHLHVRRTDWINGTRWEEVSLGYPRQWEKIRDNDVTIADVLRQIHPPPRSAMLSMEEDEDERVSESESESAAGKQKQKQRQKQQQKTTWRIFGGR